MTLQQFKMQMSLSRGALYWLILNSSFCAKSRNPCACFCFALPFVSSTEAFSVFSVFGETGGEFMSRRGEAGAGMEAGSG